MRYIGLLCGSVLLFCSAAFAQANAGNTSLLTSPTFALTASPLATSYGLSPGLTALALEPAPAATSSALPSAPVANAAANAQEVYGVYQEYPMQVFVGYTFTRFYEIPSFAKNLNGFDLGVAYYFNNWIAADGEFAMGFGSQSGESAHLCFGGGGARVRWAGPRGIEIWGHGLAGHSCFVPQTPYGGQSAFAFEGGAGVDINAHHRRFAYRIQGDAVGTRFFGTYQYSPRITAGIVIKF
ncbi:MAG: hypothetical protein WAJ92_14165 [Candidatus Acidiferrales bacterium]